MKRYRWKRSLVDKFSRLADRAAEIADEGTITGKASYERYSEGPWLDYEMEIEGVPYEVVIQPISET